MYRHAPAVERDDVKTSARVRRDDLEIVGGEPPQRGAFARVDARDRAPETTRNPALDLNEDDRFTIAADQVDFAARKAHVSSDDAVSRLTQNLRCVRFAVPPAACTIVCQPRSSALPGHATIPIDDERRVHVL